MLLLGGDIFGFRPHYAELLELFTLHTAANRTDQHFFGKSQSQSHTHNPLDWFTALLIAPLSGFACSPHTFTSVTQRLSLSLSAALHCFAFTCTATAPRTHTFHLSHPIIIISLHLSPFLRSSVPPFPLCQRFSIIATTPSNIVEQLDKGTSLHLSTLRLQLQS